MNAVSSHVQRVDGWLYGRTTSATLSSGLLSYSDIHLGIWANNATSCSCLIVSLLLSPTPANKHKSTINFSAKPWGSIPRQRRRMQIYCSIHSLGLSDCCRIYMYFAMDRQRSAAALVHSSHRLTLAITLHPQKERSRVATRRFPDHSTHNQIDVIFCLDASNRASTRQRRGRIEARILLVTTASSWQTFPWH